jgi:uncharacterized protein YkwD
MRWLPGLLVVAVLVAAEEKGREPGPAPSADEKAVLELTNKVRADRQLPLLTVNATLTKVARAHSANMAKQEKMEHVLDGKTPAERVKAAGYDYARVGENVAVGENVSVRRIVEGWMASKGHRENILEPEYAETGIGTARNDKGEVYYTQLFGSPRKK